MREDGEIDYSRYSYRELLEALNNINSRKYPLNYANLQAALEKIGPEQRAALERDPEPEPESLLGDDNPADDFQSDPDVRRVKHLVTALVVAGLCVYLLWVDDVILPFEEPLRISLSGLGATIAEVAFLFALAVPASFVVDYVDTRDNRKKYLLFAMFSESIATLLLIFAAVISASPVTG